MLINLRNALMTGKRLPYDAEIEFLESTGTQWINLGIIPNEYTGVSLTAASTGDGGQYNRLFGTQVDGVGKTMTIRSSSMNGGSFYMETGSANVYVGTFDTDIHTFKFNIPLHSIVFDGTIKATPTTSNSITGTCWLWGTNGESRFHGKYRVYGLEFYDMQSGTLTAKFIPVRKGTVGYLYDRVSGKLFGNAGTGDFVLGPDVVPVEYIESHGTEWIDTDKSVDLPMHLEADINFTNPNTGSNVQTFVGGYNSDLTNQRFWVTSLPQGRINCGLLTNSISANLVPANKKVHLVVDFENGRQVSTIDGVQYTSASQSTTNYWFRNWKLRIFQSFGTVVASNNIPLQAITNRIDIDIGGSQALRLRPVRVGTEGAMMDTLTRRIYRNAGTGAFAYGNDLPYPIPAS